MGGRTKNQLARDRRRREKAAQAAAQGADAAAGQQLPGNWVPPQIAQNAAPDLRQRAYKFYDNAMAVVEKMKAQSQARIAQQTLEQMRSFILSTSPSPNDILAYLKALKQHHLSIAPMKITSNVQGDKVHVPVSTAKPKNLEDRTYHLVIIKDDLTGDEIHLLAEEFSGYLKAFRVVLRGEKAFDKPFYRLGTEELPTRFKEQKPTNYSDGYERVDGISIDSRTFRRIFDFFLSFNDNPLQATTSNGQSILETAYVCLFESPRFKVVEKLVIVGVTMPEDTPLELPTHFPAFMHGWSGMSKDIFQLYLAILEVNMQRIGMSSPDAQKTMMNARSMWEICLNKHSVIFRPKASAPKAAPHRSSGNIDAQETPDDAQETPDDALDLGFLCGGHLNFLSFDSELCDKILMRTNKFRGYWIDEIQGAFESGELNLHFLI